MKLLFLLVCLPVFSFGQNEIFYITEGQKALQNQDYKTYLRHFKKAVKLADYHPWVQSQLARAYLLNKQEKKAIKVLQRLIKMQVGMDFTQDSLFQQLAKNIDYKTIGKQLSSNLQAKTTSQLAFQTQDPFLIPEGICHDEKTGTFYLSSIHQRKIIAINEKGEISDFCEKGANGLWGVLGMKIDAQKRHLWVCSPIGQDGDSLAGNAGIFKFDLDRKQLIKSYWLKKREGKKHLFNDLILTKNGDVYFTDSDGEAIYTIPHQSDQIELFLSTPKLSYPNGIAINPEENTLFVSTVGKLYRIDLSSKKMKPIKKAKHLFTGGFDGLYWYQDGLIGIQNSFRPQRIIHFQLNAKQNRVIEVKELERNAPHYVVPTTGVIVNDNFYYISNSYINRYQPNMELKKEDFGPAKIYKIPLVF